ncbi:MULTISPECIES: TetR/AcrR family transcriptional regulator [Streptomyces]|uniref:TetR/AcrR family transcriptional regulator n=1 Tax=Streptomyces kaempferi TaxID=333725 RepID=A0ABW3XT25_9ACTN|nr:MULTISPECIES: TetR/AcrR family transcriptional regulator [unclassified Streptomyces]QIY60893.1 TetR/AcrR family transcriptional regulator [Streptomyces sp. RPA4-2]
MPKSPTKRRPLTRAALTESAWALFTEKGFHATSISDIVERAGLTRGAFYSNYRDKEELFLALYDIHTDRLLADLDTAAVEPEPGEHPIVQLRERVAGRTPQERQWFLVSMEFTLHAARNPAVAEQLAVHEDRLTQGLTDVLTRTLARAGAQPVVPAGDLARLLIALFEGLTAHQLIHGPTRGLEHLTPHLVHALTTPAPPGTLRPGPDHA